ALATRIFPMPLYGKKAEKAKPFQLQTVRLVAHRDSRRFFDYGFATGEGTNRVRFLGTIPPNMLHTKTYGEVIRTLASDYGLQFKFYSNQELKKMGAGAFTAVDQGNPDSAGGIYELTYNPRGAKNKDFVCLVGKGLCYDTGGHDIK